MEALTKANAKKRAFLAAYTESGTIRGAASASGVAATSHYGWLRSDETYVEAFTEAKEQAIAMLEEEATRRAVQGVRRLKFDSKGKPFIDPETGEPYVEYAYSDVLLIFLLKAADPEKYAEFKKVSVDGKAEHKVDMKALADRMDQTDGFAEFLADRACRSDTDPTLVHQKQLEAVTVGAAIPTTPLAGIIDAR